MRLRAAVAGASGYAGGEVLRLLADHPDIEVTTVTAATSAGTKLGQHQPHIPQLADLTIQETSVDALGGHDLVVLALPHGHSGTIGDTLASKGDGAVIADLAADHRLVDAQEWASYYGGAHSPAWSYGMPELLHDGEDAATSQRALLSSTRRIAVPGCNATAVTLAAQCAVRAGIIHSSNLVATLSVGYSGAGRTLKPHLLASQAVGTIAPYAVGGTHRHIPEILQNLRVAGGPANMRLTFTPVLVPTSRGILATVVAPLAPGMDEHSLEAALAPYAHERLVDITTAPTWPTTGPLTGTGRAMVSWSIDERAGTLVMICAIDNLGKGTAAAAVQSANLALGIPEFTGVPMTGVNP
ncbi:N-acetyl-gamma-glutamyl-phosphate reductase [Schaalia sp. 19OD2882]|nr:N-acetyl-gamma-glutamyl-phosphate reductase [Schaalia sp. 19OD2882]